MAIADVIKKPFVWVPVTIGLVFWLAVLYASRLYAPCDDTFIYLVYIKNFFAGNGLTYNGMRVQGFTSVVWMALLALGGYLSRDFPEVANRLSLAAGALALLATYMLARRLELSRPQSIAAAMLVALAGDFAFYMSNGLETVFFTATLVTSVALAMSTKPDRTLLLPFLPIVLAIMVLTRPEGGLVAGVVIFYLAWRAKRTYLAVVPIIGSAVLIAPVLWRLHAYYGDWLPNTYYAKGGAGLTNADQGLIYLANFLDGISLTVVLVIFLTIFRSRAAGRRVLPLWAVIAAWTLNLVVQGGDNMVGARMFVPILPLMFLLLLAGLRNLPRRVTTVAVFAVGVSLVVKYNFGHVYGSSWDLPVKTHVEQWRTSFDRRREFSTELRRRVDPGSMIAVSAAGIIPYYTGLPTIDMLGLNNRYIARHGKFDRRLPYGHQLGDGDYVLSQEPDVIMLSSRAGGDEVDYVGDREILESTEFKRNYTQRELPGGYKAYFRLEHQPRRGRGRR